MKASRQKVVGLLRKAGWKVGRPNRLGQYMHADYTVSEGITCIYVNDMTRGKRILNSRIFDGYDNVEVE